MANQRIIGDEGAFYGTEGASFYELRASSGLESTESGSARQFAWFIFGALSGVLLTFLLDPISGRSRRAYLRDKGITLKRRVLFHAAKRARDLKNRASGFALKTRNAGVAPEVDDETLKHRVRSHIGRVVSHVKAIEVEVNDGTVRLRGPILAWEVRNLMDRVNGVPGVKAVTDELDVHESPAHISSLQGEGKPYLQRRP